jgi:tetratricopeptide (TPR) repeat protein
MSKWMVAICLSLATIVGAAQGGDVNKADELYKAGKRLEALPLYEQLAKDFPKEWLYAERLADCLGVKVLQLTDPAEIKALRTRERDEAKRAVELGDPHYYLQIMANIDPSAPLNDPPAGTAERLLQEAEKAFSTGDFNAAMQKYIAASDADPKLYQAPLFAGDTAYHQKDLKTAAHWFARAISVDPDRETAYRYWGDAIMRYSNDPQAAKEKFIDAIIAEPYNKLAWQGIQQWAQTEKAVILAPKIERPAAPKTDPKKPNNINITLDPNLLDNKKHPGSAAWMMYSLIRAEYQGDEFKKKFPDEKVYRHTLQEEDHALDMVLTSLKEQKVKPEKLDESLRTLLDLNNAGMLDCWILLSAPDQGIAQDYDAYRKEHRQLLHDYLAKYVIHGGAQ